MIYQMTIYQKIGIIVLNVIVQKRK